MARVGVGRGALARATVVVLLSAAVIGGWTMFPTGRAGVLLGVIRQLVGLILVVAGAAKLADGAVFATTLRAFWIAPRARAILLGHCLAFAELAVGMSLVLGAGTPWTNFAAAGMFALFGVAIVARVLAGPVSTTCGCFGPHFSSRITWRLASRCAGLAALALLTTG